MGGQADLTLCDKTKFNWWSMARMQWIEMRKGASKASQEIFFVSNSWHYYRSSPGVGYGEHHRHLTPPKLSITAFGIWHLAFGLV
jgi:hypothetical protein